MARLNHLPNLEALRKLLGAGTQRLGVAWAAPSATPSFKQQHEQSYRKLDAKLREIQAMEVRVSAELRAGRETEELEQIDFRLKEAGRIAEQLRADWPAG